MKTVFMCLVTVLSASSIFPQLAGSPVIHRQNIPDTIGEQKPAEQVELATEPNTHGSNEYSCKEIQGKVASFSKMHNAGYGLLIGGGVLLGIGAVLIVNANGVMYYSYDSNYGESGNLGGGIGADLAGFGIIMAVAGTVLTIIGGKKLREFRERSSMQQCRLDVELTPNSLELVYRF